jgi:spore germination protein GerM
MTEDGFVVFQKDNPSGLPQNADEFRVPIKFDIAEKMKVKAYFINDKLDPQISCNKVFAVEREVAKTERVAKAALDELLKGPSQADLNAGYSTSINTGVIIQSVTAKDGILTVDFNDQLEYQAGGSCKTAAIRAQITQTLMQFSTVKSVIISINGRTEDILQP